MARGYTHWAVARNLLTRARLIKRANESRLKSIPRDMGRSVPQGAAAELGALEREQVLASLGEEEAIGAAMTRAAARAVPVRLPCLAAGGICEALLAIIFWALAVLLVVMAVVTIYNAYHQPPSATKSVRPPIPPAERLTGPSPPASPEVPTIGPVIEPSPSAVRQQRQQEVNDAAVDVANSPLQGTPEEDRRARAGLLDRRLAAAPRTPDAHRGTAAPRPPDRYTVDASAGTVRGGLDEGRLQAERLAALASGNFAKYSGLIEEHRALYKKHGVDPCASGFFPQGCQ